VNGSIKLSPLVREISWTNNLIIFSRTKTEEEREFYLKLSLQEKYGKRELEKQISSSFYEKVMLGKANPSPVVREINIDLSSSFKDSYVFEFLNLPEPHNESDLKSNIGNGTFLYMIQASCIEKSYFLYMTLVHLRRTLRRSPFRRQPHRRTTKQPSALLPAHFSFPGQRIKPNHLFTTRTRR